jgi:nucleoside-diphosphate-sugar epimerase
MTLAKTAIGKDDINDNNNLIVLAGATGALGNRIAVHLLNAGAKVRALVRSGTPVSDVKKLHELGARTVTVDFSDLSELTSACTGGACVVSALSGLRDVIVDLQSNLLKAAVDSGVPRFIPSDYCIDYTKLFAGHNRNLDVRREFMEIADKAPIRVTSILNGMFMDLLTGQAPVILFKIRRIFFWGNDNQLMDFTTMDDTASFTAAAALDHATPRFLRIAGEVANVKTLQRTATQVTGKKFRLFRAGGLPAFKVLIRITRTLLPKKDEVFPPWQGMQYLYDMFTGLPRLQPLDNHRYPNIRWTTLRELLAAEKH